MAFNREFIGYQIHGRFCDRFARVQCFSVAINRVNIHFQFEFLPFIVTKLTIQNFGCEYSLRNSI